ncbi:MAG: lysophospholipid acyltransferase family protein [Deltaproteobacteria bacterium]|uniref:lysophospholipid acyltransferase family protein n=1 Tax=Desulfobacula sp. TaxID=2593537 RepID=UPI0019A35A3A|nr:lysophospholipid acyltransferase family protein [Candidatus Desulfobacula maris]MBL6993295.1 lysophospholipid acyltransferase family protein [Desulfobacula sp.]
MFKKLKFIIYTRPFIVFVYYFIQIYSMTFRLSIVNEKKWQDLLKKGRPILLCAWHQQFFSIIRHFKTYSKFNPGLMISQSRDGELIAGVANKTGWHTLRGSSSRGGKKAMEGMIEHLITNGLGAHILDGPTGPIGKVKAGVIKMAQETNAIVVPVYTHAEHAWFFNSWDRFMLPKPFSKITLTFGDGMHLVPDGTSADFEAQRQLLEDTMLPGLILKSS